MSFVTFEIIIIGILALCLVILMLTVKKKYLFYNSLLGVAILLIVNLLSGVTGVYLGFGIYTLLFSIILGGPAVAAMIVLNLL